MITSVPVIRTGAYPHMPITVTAHVFLAGRRRDGPQPAMQPACFARLSRHTPTAIMLATNDWPILAATFTVAPQWNSQ